MPELFRRFWDEDPAYNNKKQLVEITLKIAKKVGVADVIGRIVKGFKNELEPCRMVTMEAIEKIVANMGATKIDAHLEELLLDACFMHSKSRPAPKLIM